MKAILTYEIVTNGAKIEETRLFDTEKSTKICDVKNAYGEIMYELYISKTGILFAYNEPKSTIRVVDQEKEKKWIGECEPDKYIEFFGKPEEA